MADEPIQIKRYPNRRFYARNTSKYVSLPEIEDLIQQGNTIEVQDSQTGEDITRAVLAQIIMDRQPEKMALFPIDMLHYIVRSNDMMADFLRDYFRHSLTYLDYLKQHGTSAQGLANPMHWVKAWLDGFRPPGVEVEPVAEVAGQGEASTLPNDDATIAARIEQLEARIRQLEAKE
jgi:polyhydroxyalkanoate synthesis repressor PhaR